MKTIDNTRIPERVITTLGLLEYAGFEAYIVGGCVRDLILGREPKDYDITTNATPNEIMGVFEHTDQKIVYENSFGTVIIIDEELETSNTLKTLEITPYRIEADYSDHRHPDTIQWGSELSEDLLRRDFTINAMAYYPGNYIGYLRDIFEKTLGKYENSKGHLKDIYRTSKNILKDIYRTSKGHLIDLYNGENDCDKKIINTVGNPDERFSEDALRMMRAVRFSSELGYSISHETLDSIEKNSQLLKNISQERITDEFTKIILSPSPQKGIDTLRDTRLLEIFLPELLEGFQVEQNRNHIYDIYTHLVNAVQNSADQDWNLQIRLASLFHDIGKPRTKRFDTNKHEYTFYGHEVVGARMVEKIMKRMRFSKELTENVIKLVRYHMFFSDPDQITLSAVRRMVVNVGEGLIWDLMRVRRSDRIGMGRPKAAPFRLRMYESMIEEALRDPISVKMLKVNGDILISEFNMKPGKRIGWILYTLLDEVLEDPKRNTREYLNERVRDLMEKTDETLARLAEKGRGSQETLEEQEIKTLRKKHKVNFTK